MNGFDFLVQLDDDRRATTLVDLSAQSAEHGLLT